MGYYIMPNSRYGEGPFIEKIESDGKAVVIADEFEGELLSSPPNYEEATRRGYALVVVTDTGEFDRAEYATTKEDYERLIDPADTRPKQYVALRKDTADNIAVFREEE